jgi:hypothetical protein
VRPDFHPPRGFHVNSLSLRLCSMFNGITARRGKNLSKRLVRSHPKQNARHHHLGAPLVAPSLFCVLYREISRLRQNLWHIILVTQLLNHDMGNDSCEVHDQGS